MEKHRQDGKKRGFGMHGWLRSITQERARYVPGDGPSVDLSGHLDERAFEGLDDDVDWDISLDYYVSVEGTVDSPIPGRKKDLERLLLLHPPTLPPLSPGESVVKPGQ
jgi:hypothetical protein